jgi:hypothetical protein
MRGVHGLSGVLLYFILPPRRRVLAGAWMRVTHGNLDPRSSLHFLHGVISAPCCNRRNVMRGSQALCAGLSADGPIHPVIPAADHRLAPSAPSGRKNFSLPPATSQRAPPYVRSSCVDQQLDEGAGRRVQPAEERRLLNALGRSSLELARAVRAPGGPDRDVRLTEGTGLRRCRFRLGHAVVRLHDQEHDEGHDQEGDQRVQEVALRDRALTDVDL